MLQEVYVHQVGRQYVKPKVQVVSLKDNLVIRLNPMTIKAWLSARTPKLAYKGPAQLFASAIQIVQPACYAELQKYPLTWMIMASTKPSFPSTSVFQCLLMVKNASIIVIAKQETSVAPMGTKEKTLPLMLPKPVV
jgi:hypothetical protein